MQGRIILNIFFIFLFSGAFSQENDAIREIKEKLKAYSAQDTVKVNLYNDLSWEYSYYDPRASIAQCFNAIHLSKKLNFTNGEANAYNTLGDNYRSLALYDSAFYFLNKALALRKKQNRIDKVAGVTLNIANVYNQKKDLTNAFLKYKEAIKIAEGVHYEKAMLVALTNMADAYRAVGSYDKGMEALNKALEINKKLNDTQQLPYLYGTLAQIQHEMKNSVSAIEYGAIALKYLEKTSDVYLKATVLTSMGTFYFAIGNNDSSLVYYNRTIELEKEMGDSIGLSIVNGNIANTYRALGLLDLAIKHASISAEIAQNIKDTSVYYNSTMIIANIYAQKGEFKQALDKALSVLPLIELQKQKNDLYQSYYTLSKIYKGLNNHDKRAEYLEKAYQYKDSIMTDQNNKTAAKLNIEFDVYGKEKEIELLNKTSELKETELAKQKSEKRFITWIAGLFGLIVIVIVFFFIKIRKSNVIINKQKERVESQNEIILNQKHLVEEKQKEIIDSINYAQRIQSAVLTSEDVWKKISPEHFILFKPKDIVSGDFYWAYNTPNNRSVFALADCTGHGVPGGFMSMLGNSFLNEIVVENKIFSAPTILNKLREKIIKSLEQKGEEQRKDGMDIALCVWNKLNNTLEFAGANNAMILIREGKLQEIKADKMPIGTYINDTNSFTGQTIQLQPGDCIYMTTDGYPDQFGGTKGKKFKYKQFEELLVSTHNKPMSEQKEILDNSFVSWKGSLDQIDDVCVIGVRI